MLRIEKDSFEKEVTRITLQSAPSFVQPGGGTGGGATANGASTEDGAAMTMVSQFVNFNGMLRTRIRELSAAKVRRVVGRGEAVPPFAAS